MKSIGSVSSDMVANNLTPFLPTHPGSVLREEIEERKITQTQLAKQIGVPISIINEVVSGERAITTEYALLLEAALGIDADFWLNMQTAYNKQVVKSDTTFMERLANIKRIAAVF